MATNELSFYIHIPYCVKRCGYCDFNTYTPAELKIESSLQEVSTSYIDLLLQELKMARATAGAATIPTIFFGGGTPSLMSPSDLGRVITFLRENFGLNLDCEITLEANPDSISREKLEGFLAAGINRLSFGMQSAVPHVLATLDRTHNPENVAKSVELAREVGFKEISVDLIYGTPGESIEDWQASISAALAMPITHISAYALIVETGTKLAAAIKRGEINSPDDDLMAEKYLMADTAFSAAGLTWYELSNWSKPGSAARHNIAYWEGANWWGAGPGAHSHINGRRWWNVKHPNAYRERMEAGTSPEMGFEILTDVEKDLEKILLQIRIPGGLKIEDFTGRQIAVLNGYRERGCIDGSAWDSGLLTLTREGRLIADAIVRDLTINLDEPDNGL